MKIGEAPERLTKDIDRDVDPRWTADGQFIYWSSDKSNAGSLAVDKIDIVTKRRSRVAAIESVSMIQPTLSPDGNRFAYTTGSGLTEVMDIATRTRTPLVPQVSPQPQVSRPFWSRDGSKLMVVDNDRVNPRFREGYNKLRVIDIATKTATFYGVGPEPASISDRTEGAAVWSPDSPEMKSNVDIIIKGNRITSIEAHDSNRPQAPGTTFVDASQQTVLP